MRRISFFTSGVRVLLGGTLLFSSTVPAWAESNIWAERRQARLSRESSSSEIGLQARVPASLPAAIESVTVTRSLSDLPVMADGVGQVPAWLPAVVAPHGTLKEVHLSPSADAPFIVHIQDVHDAQDAQRSIAGLLTDLDAARGLSVVGLEGSRGAFDFAAFTAYPDKPLTRAVADFFLAQGYLGGAELAAIRTDGKLPLWGLEDESLYLQNVQAVRDGAASDGRVSAALAAVRVDVERRKGIVYSQELKNHDKKISAYHRQTEGLKEYVQHLNSAGSMGGYPQLALLAKALKAEDALDFTAVERERRRMVEALAARAPAAELEKLLPLSLEVRAGRLSQRAFHQHLKEFCGRHGVSWGKFPGLAAYADYISLAESLRRDDLWTELNRREAAVGDLLARTPAERALLAEDRRLTLTEKLAAHQMTPDDWAAYQALPPAAVGDLSNQDLAPYENFCRTALARNEALVGNLLSAPRRAEGRVSALVAGGFHTEGMTALLRKKGASYAVVTPRIGEIPKDSRYLDIFVRDPLPLEKLFAGAPISLKAENLGSAQTMDPGAAGRKGLLSIGVLGLVGALLSFQGKAAAEIAPLTNLSPAKAFSLQVEGKGRVVVARAGDGAAIQVTAGLPAQTAGLTGAIQLEDGASVPVSISPSPVSAAKKISKDFLRSLPAVQTWTRDVFITPWNEKLDFIDLRLSSVKSFLSGHALARTFTDKLVLAGGFSFVVLSGLAAVGFAFRLMVEQFGGLAFFGLPVAIPAALFLALPLYLPATLGIHGLWNAFMPGKWRLSQAGQPPVFTAPFVPDQRNTGRVPSEGDVLKTLREVIHPNILAFIDQMKEEGVSLTLTGLMADLEKHLKDLNDVYDLRAKRLTEKDEKKKNDLTDAYNALLKKIPAHVLDFGEIILKGQHGEFAARVKSTGDSGLHPGDESHVKLVKDVLLGNEVPLKTRATSLIYSRLKALALLNQEPLNDPFRLLREYTATSPSQALSGPLSALDDYLSSLSKGPVTGPLTPLTAEDFREILGQLESLRTQSIAELIKMGGVPSTRDFVTDSLAERMRSDAGVIQEVSDALKASSNAELSKGFLSALNTLSPREGIPQSLYEGVIRALNSGNRDLELAALSTVDVLALSGGTLHTHVARLANSGAGDVQIRALGVLGHMMDMAGKGTSSVSGISDAKAQDGTEMGRISAIFHLNGPDKFGHLFEMLSGLWKKDDKDTLYREAGSQGLTDFLQKNMKALNEQQKKDLAVEAGKFLEKAQKADGASSHVGRPSAMLAASIALSAPGALPVEKLLVALAKTQDDLALSYLAQAAAALAGTPARDSLQEAVKARLEGLNGAYDSKGVLTMGVPADAAAARLALAKAYLALGGKPVDDVVLVARKRGFLDLFSEDERRFISFMTQSTPEGKLSVLKGDGPKFAPTQDQAAYFLRLWKGHVNKVRRGISDSSLTEVLFFARGLLTARDNASLTLLVNPAMKSMLTQNAYPKLRLLEELATNSLAGEVTSTAGAGLRLSSEKARETGKVWLRVLTFGKVDFTKVWNEDVPDGWMRVIDLFSGLIELPQTMLIALTFSPSRLDLFLLSHGTREEQGEFAWHVRKWATVTLMGLFGWMGGLAAFFAGLYGMAFVVPADWGAVSLLLITSGAVIGLAGMAMTQVISHTFGWNLWAPRGLRLSTTTSYKRDKIALGLVKAVLKAKKDGDLASYKVYLKVIGTALLKDKEYFLLDHISPADEERILSSLEFRTDDLLAEETRVFAFLAQSVSDARPQEAEAAYFAAANIYGYLKDLHPWEGVRVEKRLLKDEMESFVLPIPDLRGFRTTVSLDGVQFNFKVQEGKLFYRRTDDEGAKWRSVDKPAADNQYKSPRGQAFMFQMLPDMESERGGKILFRVHPSKSTLPVEILRTPRTEIGQQADLSKAEWAALRREIERMVSENPKSSIFTVRGWPDPETGQFNFGVPGPNVPLGKIENLSISVDRKTREFSVETLSLKTDSLFLGGGKRAFSLKEDEPSIRISRFISDFQRLESLRRDGGRPFSVEELAALKENLDWLYVNVYGESFEDPTSARVMALFNVNKIDELMEVLGSPNPSPLAFYVSKRHVMREFLDKAVLDSKKAARVNFDASLEEAISTWESYQDILGDVLPLLRSYADWLNPSHPYAQALSALIKEIPKDAESLSSALDSFRKLDGTVTEAHAKALTALLPRLNAATLALGKDRDRLQNALIVKRKGLDGKVRRAVTAYELLGVSEDATTEEIKKAYIRRVRGVHSDKTKGSDGPAKILNECKDLLSDKYRAAYDNFMRLGTDEYPSPSGGAGSWLTRPDWVRAAPWLESLLVSLVALFLLPGVGEHVSVTGFDIFISAGLGGVFVGGFFYLAHFVGRFFQAFLGGEGFSASLRAGLSPLLDPTVINLSLQGFVVGVFLGLGTFLPGFNFFIAAVFPWAFVHARANSLVYPVLNLSHQLRTASLWGQGKIVFEFDKEGRLLDENPEIARGMRWLRWRSGPFGRLVSTLFPGKTRQYPPELVSERRSKLKSSRVVVIAVPQKRGPPRWLTSSENSSMPFSLSEALRDHNSWAISAALANERARPGSSSDSRLSADKSRERGKVWLRNLTLGRVDFTGVRNEDISDGWMRVIDLFSGVIELPQTMMIALTFSPARLEAFLLTHGTREAQGEFVWSVRKWATITLMGLFGWIGGLAAFFSGAYGMAYVVPADWGAVSLILIASGAVIGLAGMAFTQAVLHTFVWNLWAPRGYRLSAGADQGELLPVVPSLPDIRFRTSKGFPSQKEVDVNFLGIAFSEMIESIKDEGLAGFDSDFRMRNYEDLRELHAGNYRLFYRVYPDTREVVLLDFTHAKNTKVKETSRVVTDPDYLDKLDRWSADRSFWIEDSQESRRKLSAMFQRSVSSELLDASPARVKMMKVKRLITLVNHNQLSAAYQTMFFDPFQAYKGDEPGAAISLAKSLEAFHLLKLRDVSVYDVTLDLLWIIREAEEGKKKPSELAREVLGNDAADSFRSFLDDWQEKFRAIEVLFDPMGRADRAPDIESMGLIISYLAKISPVMAQRIRSSLSAYKTFSPSEWNESVEFSRQFVDEELDSDSALPDIRELARLYVAHEEVHTGLEKHIYAKLSEFASSKKESDRRKILTRFNEEASSLGRENPVFDLDRSPGSGTVLRSSGWLAAVSLLVAALFLVPGMQWWAVFVMGVAVIGTYWDVPGVSIPRLAGAAGARIHSFAISLTGPGGAFKKTRLSDIKPNAVVVAGKSIGEFWGMVLPARKEVVIGTARKGQPDLVKTQVSAEGLRPATREETFGFRGIRTESALSDRIVDVFPRSAPGALSRLFLEMETLKEDALIPVWGDNPWSEVAPLLDDLQLSGMRGLYGSFSEGHLLAVARAMGRKASESKDPAVRHQVLAFMAHLPALVKKKAPAEADVLTEKALEAFHRAQGLVRTGDIVATAFIENKVVMHEVSADMLQPGADSPALRALMLSLQEAEADQPIVLTVKDADGSISAASLNAFSSRLPSHLKRLTVQAASGKNGLLSPEGQILSDQVLAKAGLAGMKKVIFALDAENWDTNDLYLLLGGGWVIRASDIGNAVETLIVIAQNA